MTKPVGWYVRVSGQPVWDGSYDTILYVAGYEMPMDARAAVKEVSQAPDDLIQVLPDAILPGRGPQPAPYEVRLLTGAA